jgi:putative ABC transport system substrate-binding protein
LATLRTSIAQPITKQRRIGLLRSSTPSADKQSVAAFLDGMRELGWVEGQNLHIEYRWAEGRSERLPELAADLVRLDVEVVVVSSTPGAQAAVRATRRIPIVFGMVSDPVASGIVASLARPDGNATGWSNTLPDLTGKLKDIAPTVSRVAVLWSPANPGKRLEFNALQAVAQVRGVTLHSIEVATSKDLDVGFSSIVNSRVDAMITFIDSVTFSSQQRIVEFAARQQLPAVYQAKEFVKAGGLLSYSANIDQQWRRTASYVDKILKGAKPGDLPVEQPTKFELVINLKTAKALGLAIPQSLPVRADEVFSD